MALRFFSEHAGTVTTGPQPGSPQPPSQVSLMQTLTSVKIKWRNQQQRQREALIGYLIEGKASFATLSIFYVFVYVYGCVLNGFSGR